MKTTLTSLKLVLFFAISCKTLGQGEQYLNQCNIDSNVVLTIVLQPLFTDSAWQADSISRTIMRYNVPKATFSIANNSTDTLHLSDFFVYGNCPYFVGPSGFHKDLGCLSNFSQFLIPPSQTHTFLTVNELWYLFLRHDNIMPSGDYYIVWYVNDYKKDKCYKSQPVFLYSK